MLTVAVKSCEMKWKYMYNPFALLKESYLRKKPVRKYIVFPNKADSTFFFFMRAKLQSKIIFLLNSFIEE